MLKLVDSGARSHLPFSPAFIAGDLMFVSGQASVDSASGAIIWSSSSGLNTAAAGVGAAAGGGLAGGGALGASAGGGGVGAGGAVLLSFSSEQPARASKVNSRGLNSGRARMGTLLGGS